MHAVRAESVQEPEELEEKGSHAKNKQTSLLNFPQSLIFYTAPQVQGGFLFFLENIETEWV